MNVLKTLLAALAAFCLLASTVRAGGRVLEVGAYVLPPLTALDESGRVCGDTVDRLRRVLGAMGYESEFRALPLKRCLAGMLDGDLAMMLPLVETEGRSKYMLFSETVVHLKSVFWKRDPGLVRCWETPADLAGLRIGVAFGYAYGPEWARLTEEHRLDVIAVSGMRPEKTLFSMLEADRLDLFLCDRSVGEYVKALYRPQFDDIVPCPCPVGEAAELKYSVSKAYFDKRGQDPGSFLTRLNEALAADRAR